MGSTIFVALDQDGCRAAGRLADLPMLFEIWEQALSRFRPDSELCTVNAQAGTLTRVSPAFYAVLCQAVAAARRTDGLVTPAVLPALLAAGYTRSFDAGLDSTWAQEAEPVAADWRDIQIDPARHTVRMPPAMQLDFGGIGKGWAADEVARHLSMYGPVLVDAGGDIAVSGPRADGSAWPVGVMDPREDDADLALLMIRQGGVATSGRDFRRWKQPGAWQHHLIDPRTGRPAETDVLTATVAAPSAGEADVAAKMSLLLGSTAGLAWIDARPQLAALLVLEDGTVQHSSALSRLLWSES